MTKYTDDTPITEDLLRGAIVLELKRQPLDTHRLELYARAIGSIRQAGYPAQVPTDTQGVTQMTEDKTASPTTIDGTLRKQESRPTKENPDD